MNLWRDDMAGWKTIANFFTTHEFFVVKAISANKSYNWRVSWATDTHSVWFNKNDLIFLLPIYTSYVHIKIKAWSVIIFNHTKKVTGCIAKAESTYTWYKFLLTGCRGKELWEGNEVSNRGDFSARAKFHLATQPSIPKL